MPFTPIFSATETLLAQPGLGLKINAVLKNQLTTEILKTLGEENNAALKAAVQGLDLQPETLAGQTMSEVIMGSVLPGLLGKAEFQAVLSRNFEDDRKVGDTLYLGAALVDNPFAKDIVNLEKAKALGNMVGLRADFSATQLTALFGSSSGNRYTLLDTWEKEKAITPEQKTDLQEKLNLADMTRGRFGLVEKLNSEGFGKSIDLARMSKSALKGAITREDIPDGMKEDEFADEILGKAEQQYRSAHFMHRAVKETKWVDEKYRFEVPGEVKGGIQKWYNNNGSPDLMSVKLLPLFEDATPMNWDGVNPQATRQLLAFQQALKLTPDTDRANLLLKNNLWQASKIVQMSPERFAHQLNTNIDFIEEVYRAAQVADLAATTAWMGMYESMDPFAQLRFSNNRVGGILRERLNQFIPRVTDDVNDLKSLDSIEALFGPQDFCDCEHCRSVLSPAAYFVDIIRFVENHIWKTIAGELKEDDPLHLKTRRPDLWSLELSCKNTTKRIPYLDIVIDVLEKYIRASAIDKNLDLDALLDQEAPGLEFSLPYSASLDEIRYYLAHFGLKRYDLVAHLFPAHELDDVKRRTLALEKLNLSAAQAKVITDPANSGNAKAFGDDVLKFRRVSGLSAEDTEALVKMGFWKNKLSIVQMENPQGDIQEYALVFAPAAGFKYQPHLHRIVRLVQATGFSIRELNVLLQALHIGYDTLDNPALVDIADAKQLREILDIGMEELAGIIDLIPGWNSPEEEREKTLWGKRAPKTLISMSFADIESRAGAEAAGNVALIAGFLGVTATGLTVLVEKLRDGLTHENGKLKFDVKSLSLLFRYAAILRWTKSEAPVLFSVLACWNNGKKRLLDSVSDILDFAEFVRELNALQLTLEEWLSLASGSDIKKYPPSDEEKERLNSLIQHFKDKAPHEFDSKVFADLDYETKVDGLTYKQKLGAARSESIVSELLKNRPNYKKVIEFTPGKSSFRLTKNYRFTIDFKIRDIDIPYFKKGDRVVWDVLQAHHPHLILFGKWLDVDPILVKVLYKFLARLEENRTIDHVQNLMSAAPNADAVLHLISVKRTLERLISLYNKYKIDLKTAAEICLSFENGHDLLGYSYPKSWFSIYWLRALQAIGKLSIELKALTGIGDYPKSLPKTSFVELLERYYSNTVGAAEIALLAYWKKAEKNLTKAIFAKGTAGFQATDFIQDLKILTWCQALGLSPEALALFGKDEAADLKQASRTLQSAIRAACADEEAYEKRMEGLRGKVNEHKAAALCNYLIYHRDDLGGDMGFSSRSQLYQYFLLDVEMGDCYTTSRLVAATNSVQLYVHRCIMGLERSESNPGMAVSMDKEGIKQWEWRKNYRVWEANRKVFLYPENYIEPELRDNKTPQFKELEDELLQQKLDLDVVETAYKKYLTQFMELAQLRIAGSYWDKRPGEDKIYLFGRTNSQPFQYYIRHLKIYPGNKVFWSNWEKMELQIAAKEVSAVIHNNKLFVFWYSFLRKDIMAFLNGTQTIDGYTYDYFINYSFVQANGKWLNPQKLLAGYITPTDKEPFLRITKGVNMSWDEKKEREVVLQKYEDVVFKKPYPVSPGNGDVLDIYNILSHQKDLTTSTKYYWQYVLGRVTVSIPYSFTYDILRPSLTKQSISQNTYNAVINDPLLKLGFQPQIEGKIDYEYPGVTDDRRQEVFSKMWWDDSVTINGWVKAKIKITLVDQDNFTIDFIGWEFTQSVRIPEFTEVGNLPVQAMKSFFEPAWLEVSAESLLIPNPNKQPDTNLKNGKPSKDIVPVITETPGQTMLNRKLLRLSNPRITPGFEDKFVKDWSSDEKATFESEFKAFYDEGLNHYVQDGTPNFPNLGNKKFPNMVGNIELVEKRAGLQIETSFKRLVELLPGNHDDVWDTFAKGLESFFSIKSQYSIDTGANLIDPQKCFGNYFYELYFHIPFLIANHLNASGKHKEANYWYNFIFNPTALKTPEETLINPHDASWRFIKFRALTREKLSKVYSDPDAIRVYNEDPFNPHAIARMRAGSYPKNIVMKYLDNLLDWGDSLFTQFTPESVNEAMMYYVMASDILGPKPQSTGKCKTAESFTYEGIQKATDTNEFIYSVLAMSTMTAYDVAKLAKGIKDASSEAVAVFSTADMSYMTIESSGVAVARNLPGGRQSSARGVEKRGATSISRPAFCLPPNKDFLAYWDRVADRLFKIRHCQDINGTKREMPLFASEIDPALLVRAKAAGLSMDDILAMLNAELPPYRFTYLIEKAKQFCGTVQSFGGALLSALEKKDAEELTLLRSLHEQNILKLTENIKKRQIEEAKKNLENLEKTRKNIENRVEHYTKLIDTGLIPWERAQQVSKHIATGLRVTESIFSILSGTFHLIPQVGAPTAMTYGGSQLGPAATRWANSARAIGDIAENIGNLTGLEASNQRREEDWKFQLKLVGQELKAFDVQIEVAKIRIAIAEKDLEIHKKNVEQSKEVHDFYKEKFSNFGLYTYHATTLQRLYRAAYNMAYDMAKMAERAYQFERDDQAFVIQSGNWMADRAGLLAGEKLLLQLQQLEKNWMEKHRRTPEITQSFSMQQIAPDKLLELKINGSCSGFTIPEEAFDLVYPGYFKRIIKSVRITMPCVVGPYTNVGLTLSLENSSFRKADDVVAPGYVDAIKLATSTAQNDSGQFELSFRDERFLPFEGAGAVSTWSLIMADRFRAFDYNSISDIIFHISYSAEYGRDIGKVEEDLKTKFGAPSLFRLFSLRHDFPMLFNQLKKGQAPDVDVPLGSELFPYFVQGRFGGIQDVTNEYKIDENGLEEVKVQPNKKVVKKNAQAVTISKYQDMEKIKDIIWIVSFIVTDPQPA